MEPFGPPSADPHTSSETFYRGGESLKGSCRAVLPLADCVVWSDVHVFEPKVEALGYRQGHWTISHETTRSSQPMVTVVVDGYV